MGMLQVTLFESDLFSRRLTRYGGFRFGKRDGLIATDVVRDIAVQRLITLSKLRHAKLRDHTLASGLAQNLPSFGTRVNQISPSCRH